MAQLYFKYGTMAAGKSLSLLKIADSYRRTNKRVMILTSSLDTRSGSNKVSSRIGISEDAISVSPQADITVVINRALATTTFSDGSPIWPSCILVDEAEFLAPKQVADLAAIVDNHDVPVICFGLKTDFRGKLFPGSEALLELADKIEEVKSVCSWCGHKATMNLRLANGRAVYNGAQIQIGDSEYVSVCRYHYQNPMMS